MTQSYKIPSDVTVREATNAELECMNDWVRWVYEHHMPVVYWPLDNTITTLPREKEAVNPTHAVVLQMQ